MDEIRINRERLLDTLKSNRDKHRDEFKTAQEAWVKKAAKALAKAAKKAETGEIDTNPLSDLPKPQNYVKSYDDAITRLEYDVRDEVVLEDREFSAWVQDDWNWRGAFMASTSLYNG